MVDASRVRRLPPMVDAARRRGAADPLPAGDGADRRARAPRHRPAGAAALLAAWLLAAGCATAPTPTSPSAALPPAPEGASGWTDRPGTWAARQMVAAAHPLAAQAGLAMLRDGGSAVDAAIAAQMVLTLVEPQSSGIGGGLFLVLHDAGRVRTLDGRETAPAAATPDLFLRADGRPMPFAEAVVGGRSVGVPGVLRALEAAHRDHGRLPWARLFEPAIALAEGGFPVGARLATLLRQPSAATLRRDPAAAALFFEPDGTPRAAGARLRNPALAETLRAVARDGADALHRGALAAGIVRAVQGHPTNPGRLTLADLAAYTPRWREPLCVDHRAWRLCGLGPPSSGTLAVGQMLGILAAHDARTGVPLAGLRPEAPVAGAPPQLPVEAVHRLAEAGRLAFADRNRYVADADFVPLPGGSPRALLHPGYLEQRAALIGERSLGRARAGEPAAEVMALADDRNPGGGGTSHLSVVDARGQAVSMTTTIEAAFGAQVMVGGFLLNNQLTDFSFVPEEDGRPVANRVQPGKRPRSSMAPLLVFEMPAGGRAATGVGPLVMAVGSPGGSAIIPYVAKTLVATLEWGLDVQQAIALPNVGSRNGPTELEAGRVSDPVRAGLVARGHEVVTGAQTSGVQAIQRRVRDGRPAWFGAADPRREGVAVGD